jgi:putative FmdB family regulatory protein
MPLYEYVCDDCNHTWELKQKFDDPPVKICPACEGTVRRKIHANNFTFKGGRPNRGARHESGAHLSPKVARDLETGG